MNPVVHLMIMLATPLFPLLLAALLLLRPQSRVLQRAAVLAALPAMTTSLLVSSGVGATLPWLLEGSEFGLDAVGRLFLLFSSAIWLAAAVHSQTSIAPRRRGRYFVFFLLAMSGNLGAIVSRDMLAFYLFFSLMSFSAYGLVVHDESAASRRAGAWYIRLVVAGDMMLFAALVTGALESGGEVMLESVRETISESPHRSMIIALILAGFGVKAGAIGLHVALPLVYRAAPLPAAAAFAGAMLSVGLLGWLRFLPVGSAEPFWGNALAAIGLAGAFYGAIVGSVQREPAAVLAYSSVSQIGIMLAATGCALTAPHAAGQILAAIAVFALHHAFAKTALFFSIGAARRGVATRRGSLALRAGLLLPAAALPGVPLTSGSLAKEYLKEAVADASTGAGAVLADLLPWTALTTTLVVARFVWLLWPATTVRARSRRPPLETAAWLGLLVLTAVATWLQPIAQPPELAAAGVLLDLTWPAALGVGLAALIARAAGTGDWLRAPAVPAGDIGVAVAAALDRGRRAWNRVCAGPLPRARDAVLERSTAILAHPWWFATSGGLERRLAGWSLSATLFVLIVLVLTFLLLAI